MQYSQLINAVNRSTINEEVKSQVDCHGFFVQETNSGAVFVNRLKTEFNSLEEATNHIKQEKLHERLQLEIQQERYEEISDQKIADLIKHHHGDVRVTDTLVESYVDLVSSKLFTIDPVVCSVRQLNKLDCILENYIEFKLNDDTSVVITEGVQRKLNSIFGDHLDVIEHMRSGKEAFLDVLNQLED